MSCLSSARLLGVVETYFGLNVCSGEVGGFLQQTATKTLVQVAASCSTDDGCDPASAEELNCLLLGLQSFFPMVRDACMRVSLCGIYILFILSSVHGCSIQIYCEILLVLLLVKSPFCCSLYEGYFKSNYSRLPSFQTPKKEM